MIPLRKFLFFLLLVPCCLVNASSEVSQNLSAYSKCLENQRATAGVDKLKRERIDKKLSACRQEKRAFIQSHEDPEMRHEIAARIRHLENEYKDEMKALEAK